MVLSMFTRAVVEDGVASPVREVGSLSCLDVGLDRTSSDPRAADFGAGSVSAELVISDGGDGVTFEFVGTEVDTLDDSG